MLAAVSDTWFTNADGLDVAAGAFVLATGVVALLRHYQPSVAKPPTRLEQAIMLLSMGIMLLVRSAAQLRGWTGAGLTTANVISTIACVMTMVFAILSLVRTPDRRFPALGPNLPWPNGDIPIDPPSASTD
jgi:hypothetical protein